jgi:hypothetical protein
MEVIITYTGANNMMQDRVEENQYRILSRGNAWVQSIVVFPLENIR